MRTGELYQRYYGVFLGTVLSVDDPDKLGRVRIECDQYEDASDDVVWATVTRPAAGKKTGVFFTPKVGDQVVLGYLAGDVGEPVILGYAHSQPRPPSSEVGPRKHGIVTDVGRVIFDEEGGSITVTFTSPLSPVGDSFVKLDATGITLSGPQVNIIASASVFIGAPSLTFGGRPSFGPFVSIPPVVVPGLPGPAVFDFTETGASFKTGNKEFCVNGQGVLLEGFAEQIFNLHTHVPGGPPPGAPPVPVLADSTPDRDKLITDCEETP